MVGLINICQLRYQLKILMLLRNHVNVISNFILCSLNGRAVKVYLLLVTYQLTISIQNLFFCDDY